MFKKIIFFFLSIIGLNLQATNSDSVILIFKKAESQLKEIQKGLASRNESERIEANKKFIAVWETIISNPHILEYAFDSIKEVAIICPKNKKFKLITWNLYKDDGTHAFFGYLLVNNEKKIKKGFFKYDKVSSYEHFMLLDYSAAIKNPETYIGTPAKWFGMIYYSLIECDGYYTLLGYDPNDKLIARKFVDALYFKPDGTPVFGKDIFKFPRKNPKRLMFEYSSDVSMSLKYNDKRNQIIYSHLAPRLEGPVMEGLPQYYGPDGSFDALELKKDKWVTVEDVDIRNDKNKNDRTKKPDPNAQNPTYKPK